MTKPPYNPPTTVDKNASIAIIDPNDIFMPPVLNSRSARPSMLSAILVVSISSQTPFLHQHVVGSLALLAHLVAFVFLAYVELVLSDKDHHS